jgi:hypothetical protein
VFTVRLALTVANLERLATLTRAIALAGCTVRLVLAGDVVVLTVQGDPEALDRAAALLRSTLDRDHTVPAQRG